MKKIYTAALLVSMAMTATAADYVPAAISLPDLVRKEFNLPSDISKIKNTDIKDIKKVTRIGEKMNNATRTDAIGEDLVGDYWITYNDLFQQFDNGMPLIMNAEGYIEEGYYEGEYTMALPFLYYDSSALDVYISLMEFPVHVSGNKISIIDESFRTGIGTLSMKIYEAIYEGENGRLDPIDKMETEFTGSGFSFGKDYVFMVYNPSLGGGYFLAAYSSFQKSAAPTSVFNIGWKSLGNGVFQDGWLLSYFVDGDQANQDYWYYVEVQQSEIDENVYRIVNPYGVSSPVATINEGANLNGSIQFNLSDPDHVYFEAVPTNYINEASGTTQFYATNNLSIYVEGLGYDIDSSVEIMESDGFDLWSTFKDGVLTVPSRLNADGSYSNDALFSAPDLGLGVAPYFGYNWQNQETGLALNMECKLFFPGVYEAGVDEIEADSNAPVKYYNLQGVEVANPVKGQLLIKRQGSKSKKIVY